MSGRHSFPHGFALRLAAVLALAAPAPAHEPNTSCFRLEVATGVLQTQFSFDAVILERMVPELDENCDGAVTQTELTAVLPQVETYVREHLFLDLDEEESGWGKAEPFVWPHSDGSPILRPDWHLLLIQFPFRLPISRPPAVVQVTCDVFIELGMQHRIMGEFSQGGEVSPPVVFSLSEPDYAFAAAPSLATKQP